MLVPGSVILEGTLASTYSGVMWGHATQLLLLSLTSSHLIGFLRIQTVPPPTRSAEEKTLRTCDA